MSIFARPDSPPPRQPSPDILPAPLPLPTRYPRRVTSQPKIRIHSPVAVHARTKTLQPARSVDFQLSDKGNVSDGSRTALCVSPASTMSSLPSPTPSSDFVPRHRRTLSVTIPSPCPSPSPTMVAPPPPVPYIYTGPKHIICSKPVSSAHICIPGMDKMTLEAPDHLQNMSPSQPVLPPLEKHRSMGMACLKFFGLRSSTRQTSGAVAAM